MPAGAWIGDGIAVLLLVALAAMLWATGRRLWGGEVVVYRCGRCDRPTSRAYPDCTRCGAPLEG